MLGALNCSFRFKVANFLSERIVAPLSYFVKPTSTIRLTPALVRKIGILSRRLAR